MGLGTLNTMTSESPRSSSSSSTKTVSRHNLASHYSVKSTVIKPGSAQQVDPVAGPVQVC